MSTDLIFNFINAHWLNLSASIWFLSCFKGYIWYASSKSYGSQSLASALHIHRFQWMLRILNREVRVADNTAIANLERSVAFFASTTMLIIAGLITVLGSTDRAIALVDHLPLSTPTTATEWEIKIIILIFIMVYAFFKFTWSLRQYGFVTIMFGSAPMPSEGISDTEKENLTEQMASMMSMAANNFNIGLRTYYFSISILTWFLNTWLFMLTASIIVFILFRREFKSSTLRILTLDTKPKKST